MTGQPLDSETVDVQTQQAVWDRYVELLQNADSPLLTLGPDVAVQLRLQLEAVLEATSAGLNLPFESPAGRDLGDELSESIGHARATAGASPAQSLLAASLIFEAALPALLQIASARGEDQSGIRVAVGLNREILRRMSAAARGYVDHLLDRVHSSNQSERRSVSRELHDIAAPAVALGLQNLELWEMYRSNDVARATSKIHAARLALNEALRIVRNASEYLRVDIEGRGLTATVARQLDAIPASVERRLQVAGRVDSLPPVYGQELFLIVREAIRNAVDHGSPTLLTVHLNAEDGFVTGRVTDNGTGFDVSQAIANGQTVGLDSMHERATLLAATLQIDSRIGYGTTVEVRVPVAMRSASRDEEI